MKSLFPAFVFAIGLSAQLSLPAQTASDSVVATIDGKDWTKSEFDALVRTMQPDLRQAFEGNKRAWLDQYALMNHLAELAKKEGVDKMEPYRQQLEYNNLMFLAQAELAVKGATPALSSADLKNWFEAHKGQYKRARVRDICILWGQVPKGQTKARTAEEAAAILDDLTKRVKAGESFAALAKQYSEDTATSEKGGERDLIRPEDAAMNDEVKSAIFPLKPGEVSRPVKLGGGTYIFQLVSFVEPTEDDLRSEAITQIGQEQQFLWVEKSRKDAKVEIKDPAYFGLQDKAK
jgi:hypothetical protein